MPALTTAENVGVRTRRDEHLRIVTRARWAVPDDGGVIHVWHLRVARRVGGILRLTDVVVRPELFADVSVSWTHLITPSDPVAV